MITSELLISVGLFVVQMVIAVYLIRYSNQQLTRCLTSLEEKHNELVDLNGKLAKQIFSSDKKLRDDLDAVKRAHKKANAS